MLSEEEASQSSTSSLSLVSSPSSPALHFIGKKEDIVRAGRVTKLVNGCRDVLVLYHQGQLYAMDRRCYHSGGELQNGDIEEFNGRLCIVCPWHKYKITLAEGEGLYQAVENPTVKPIRTYWCSKGVKQRVHKVTEVGGNIFVTLNDSSKPIESDVYQVEKYRTMPESKTEKKTPMALYSTGHL
uniref:Rieske domain-containing protein n=1 Tax=Nothobranchius furzeri TaxID=105023 RepID=A0A8C6Q2B9_NOTFU